MHTLIIALHILYFVVQYILAPFPLRGTVRLGAVWYTITCVSTVKRVQKGTKYPYRAYFGHSFIGVPSGPKMIPRGWSCTHCCPLTASGQKAFLSVIVELLLYQFSVLSVFFQQECSHIDLKNVVSLYDNACLFICHKVFGLARTCMHPAYTSPTKQGRSRQ